jgi:chromatin-remodeling ATPase INO80
MSYVGDTFLDDLPPLRDVSRAAWNSSPLSRAIVRLYVPRAVAPPISLHCADRSFLEHQWHILDAPLDTLALYGLPPALSDSDSASAAYHELLPEVPVAGLVSSSPNDQLPLSVMQVPDAKRLIYDSAKLARLDTLLQELKAGDHRVLIYSQMTRMLDLMEEYLVFRQHKYLRLDGSSKLEDRRDMVMEWQTRYECLCKCDYVPIYLQRS